MGLLDRMQLKKHRPVRATINGDPSASIGMFTGVPLPQDPRNTLVQAILPTMSGAAGLRLSASTDRAGRYFGTNALPPLRFPLTGPPHVNQPIDLETAAFKPN